jgi:hypothetical protein
MSFLARLIERHREDARAPFPILEPRLPSRFEPAAPPAAPWAAEWDFEARRDPEARISTAPPSALGVRPRERGEPPDSGMPRSSVMPTALDTIAVPLDATASRTEPAGVPRALSPVVEGQTAAPTRPSTATTGPDLAPVSGLPEKRPAAPPLPGARPSLRPPAPAFRANRAERERPGARGGPTIHVTIGRVDVRAVVAPAAAPARPTAAAETSSLEDYLRGRAGGRR